MNDRARNHLRRWHRDLVTMSEQERTRRLHDELIDAVTLFYKDYGHHQKDDFTVFDRGQEGDSVPRLHTAATLLVFRLEHLLAHVTTYQQYMQFLHRHYRALRSDERYRKILYVLERYDPAIQQDRLEGRDCRNTHTSQGRLVHFATLS
jgi:hypothetical protein